MCEFNDKLHLNKSPFIKPSNGQMLSVLLITVLLSSVCVQFNHLKSMTLTEALTHVSPVSALM